MGALRTVIGQFENRVLGDEVLSRQVPLLHLTIAEVPLDAGASIRNYQSGDGQGAIHREERNGIFGIRWPHCEVVRSSVGILESIRTVADHDLRRIKDSVRRTDREAAAAAPGKSNPRREVLVVLIGQAAGNSVLAREQLLACAEVKAGHMVIAFNW